MKIHLSIVNGLNAMSMAMRMRSMLRIRSPCCHLSAENLTLL